MFFILWGLGEDGDEGWEIMFGGDDRWERGVLVGLVFWDGGFWYNGEGGSLIVLSLRSCQ